MYFLINVAWWWLLYAAKTYSFFGFATTKAVHQQMTSIFLHTMEQYVHETSHPVNSIWTYSPTCTKYLECSVHFCTATWVSRSCSSGHPVHFVFYTTHQKYALFNNVHDFTYSPYILTWYICCIASIYVLRNCRLQWIVCTSVFQHYFHGEMASITFHTPRNPMYRNSYRPEEVHSGECNSTTAIIFSRGGGKLFVRSSYVSQFTL